MKRSEQAALTAYPSDIYSGGKSCRRAYKDGYEQAEKDSPHWKKSSLPFKFPRIYNGMLVWDGYEISLNELKKLPKEE